ncbi:hypothetical protein ACTMS0_18425 [Micromonospora sp. H33]|uniref:hypothetical protein n=1 Tax=Micromonospora sp. H33 TaxID=3452215 RepID=UPI003F8ABBC3
MPHHAALAIAAWMVFVAHRHNGGLPLAGPLAARLRAAVTASRADPQRLVGSFLDIQEIFGPDLRDNGGLRATLVDQVTRLTARSPGAAAPPPNTLPARSSSAASSSPCPAACEWSLTRP